MKYEKITLLVLIFSWIAVFAEDMPTTTVAMHEIINNAQLRREQMIKKILQRKNNFIAQQAIAAKQIKTHQATINGIKKQQIKNPVKPMPQAIIFVSFSMPDLSLKQIIQDSARYEIPVVIRGLYHNSLQETVEKIYTLVKENNKGGILINPKWFKQYEITAVPAVVVSDSNHWDIVYGNIHLKRALTLVGEQGVPSTSKIAHNLLRKGGV